LPRHEGRVDKHTGGVRVRALLDLVVVDGLLKLVHDRMVRCAVPVGDVRNLVRNDECETGWIVDRISQHHHRSVLEHARKALKSRSRELFDVHNRDAPIPEITQQIDKSDSARSVFDGSTPGTRISRGHPNWTDRVTEVPHRRFGNLQCRVKRRRNPVPTNRANTPQLHSGAQGNTQRSRRVPNVTECLTNESCNPKLYVCE